MKKKTNLKPESDRRNRSNYSTSALRNEIEFEVGEKQQIDKYVTGEATS